ncbi:hypothetical protein [Merismopedia glauca]|uniref:Uncharacterized protein n=1 Tax=Merismopedia glauca CCAP 1448/3 TaxID=1296344 RepID=A0A2T1C9R4_9CYAN|nr:hypothetical protein [Merismopedia glauca]PSB04897.1 hypothetical protein C7B64_02075 [Merismopedia glauca CCAP 1448/3]
MSPENTRNQADNRGVLPDSNALEAHADRLIDDLFADIDNILADGTKLPPQPPTPDYPALKSAGVPQVTLPPGTSTSGENLGLPPLGYSQTTSPQDCLGGGSYQVPTLIPNLTPETPPNSPELEENIQIPHPKVEAPPVTPDSSPDEEITEDEYEIPAPSAPTRSPNVVDKLLFWGIGATLVGLAALFFLWLVSQYRLNLLRTANATTSQTAPITKEETEFIQYMQRSLKAIDQKATLTPSQPIGQTLPSTSNLPVLTPALPSLTPPPSSSVSIPVPPPAGSTR